MAAAPLPPPPPPPPIAWVAVPIPRPASHGWEVVVAVIVVAVALGGFVFFVTALRPACACPGMTPLGVVLELGPAVPSCPGSPNGSTPGCPYRVTLTVDTRLSGVAALTPADIAVSLQDGFGHDISDQLQNLTLANAAGCPIAAWLPFGHWVGASATPPCPAGTSGTALRTNDSLVLTPYPSVVWAHQGVHLQVYGTGSSISGLVETYLP